MIDVNVFICPQLDTKGLRSVQSFPAKELANYVALWDHIFIQVSKKSYWGVGISLINPWSSADLTMDVLEYSMAARRM